jgi:hypothetical protein
VSDDRTAAQEPADDPADDPAGVAAEPADAEPADEAAGPVVGDDETDPIADAQAAIEDARRRVAEAPPEVVVTNHVMGLYELAAIHLSADQPNLPAAALAIDAVACLVEGLGDRLGPDVASLRDALANIRLAFVQIKSRSQAPTGATPATEPDESTAPDG